MVLGVVSQEASPDAVEVRQTEVVGLELVGTDAVGVEEDEQQPVLLAVLHLGVDVLEELCFGHLQASEEGHGGLEHDEVVSGQTVDDGEGPAQGRDESVEEGAGEQGLHSGRDTAHALGDEHEADLVQDAEEYQHDIFGPEHVEHRVEAVRALERPGRVPCRLLRRAYAQDQVSVQRVHAHAGRHVAEDCPLAELEQQPRDAVFFALDEPALEGEGVLVERRERLFGNRLHLPHQRDPLADDGL